MDILIRGFLTPTIALHTLRNVRILHVTSIKALAIQGMASFVLTTHILVLLQVAIINHDK
jgi:hypothetical protein